MSKQNCSTRERVYILNPHVPIAALNHAFNERFEKLAALAEVALNKDFDCCPKETMYHYLAVVSDFVEELRELQKEIMKKSDKEVLEKITK